MEAFVAAVKTGRQSPEFLEQAYYASQCAVLGQQAMETNRIVTFPEAYRLRAGGSHA
jgi:hypothetical protein